MQDNKFCVGSSKMENDPDYELYATIKDDPEFESFPIPASWYKKFNIKPITADDINTRQYLAAANFLKRMYEPKDLPALIIDKPQRDGWIPPIIQVEEPKVEVIEKPLTSSQNEHGTSQSAEPSSGLT